MKYHLFLLFAFTFLPITAQDRNSAEYDSIPSYKLTIDYTNSLKVKADYLSVSERYQDAIIVGEERLSLINYILGDYNLEYAKAALDLSDYYYCANFPDKAITLCKASLSLFKNLQEDNCVQYIDGMYTLSRYYEECCEYLNAIEISNDLCTTNKKKYGSNSQEYARSLSNLTYVYYKSGQTATAIKIGEKALKIAQKANVDEPTILKIYTNLSLTYGKVGRLKESMELGKKAYVIAQNYPNSILYRNTMSILVDCYSKTGKYKEATKLAKKVMSTFDEHKKGKSYYGYLSNLANCYLNMGNYAEALELYNDIIKFEKSLNKDNIRYAHALSSSSQCCLRLNRYRDAISMQEESIEIIKKLYGENNAEYGSNLQLLGHYYLLVGNQAKSIEVQKEAIEIIKNNMGKDNSQYVDAIHSLSYAYDYSSIERLNLLQEAVKILSKLDGYSPSKSLTIKCLLANTYANLGKTEDVKKTETAILSDNNIWQYFKRDSTAYANFINMMGECHTALGEYNEAIKKSRQALKIYKDKLGDDIERYENTILNLFACYSQLKDTTHMFSILKDFHFFEHIKKELSTNMITLTTEYRRQYWKSHYHIFVDMLPLIAYVSKDSYYINLAYDLSALYAKGILLRTDRDLAQIIKNQPDIGIQKTYNSILNNKRYLDICTEEKSDSITKVIASQEDTLIQSLYSLGLLDESNVSWKDIKRNLRYDEIAIEFLTCKIDTMRINVALLLKSDFNSPKMIELDETYKLDRFLKNNNQDSLYKAIWKPIEKYIEDAKNIYFSPAGIINNIAIEYLKNDSGQCMNEKFTVYRLSTTSQILKSPPQKKHKKACLFGGLNYDFDLVGVENIVTSSQSSNVIPLDRGFREKLINRNGFDYLPNTEKEVDEIAALMQGGGTECIVFKGDTGIEGAFKNLSGEPIEIIHLSTHGMYIKQKEQNNYNSKHLSSISFFNESYVNIILPEDYAMAHSFLVMSGGNTLLRKKENPFRYEDGILTAYEISNLDLFAIDLVVLSACDTGLGDIGTDGIYGLQRGFKKAGTNTILMSLDKVDDEATKLLMVEFYRNLMNGKSKHQSLKDAQKHLRKIDNGKYNKPEYWASFIMLDGLN